MAYWLSEQLRKLSAEHVTIHDSETTSDAATQVAENYEKIMNYVAKTHEIHIITKLKRPVVTDKDIVSSLEKAGVIEA